MEWAAVIPFVATMMGVLVSVMLGMALSRLSAIETHLEKMNGKLYTHVTAPNVHESGFAKTDQQILSLMQTIKTAHSRIDHVEEAVHGKG